MTPSAIDTSILASSSSSGKSPYGSGGGGYAASSSKSDFQGAKTTMTQREVDRFYFERHKEIAKVMELANKAETVRPRILLKEASTVDKTELNFCGGKV